jgi:hypothetical protein
MKWLGMFPRLRRTAGHTIAMSDAVVVRSPAPLGQVSVSVNQCQRNVNTKVTCRQETRTITVDDVLRRGVSLDPLSIRSLPASPPHRLLPALIILPLLPTVPDGVTVNGLIGTRQVIGVRAKPE